MAVRYINGAFFGDQILPEEEFKQRIREQLNSGPMRQYLNSILSAILKLQGNNTQFYRAYELWQQFQAEFLLNKIPISLMVISNFNTGYEQSMNNTTTIDYVADQKMVLNKTTNDLLHISSVGREGIRENASAMLQQHFNTLLHTVTNDELNEMEKRKVWKKHYQAAKAEQYSAFQSRLGKKTRKSTYRWVIWGDTYPAAFRGQVADAFLNHLGVLHQSLFNSSGINMEDLSKIKFLRTVQQEESGHFFQLLVDATNSTNWMSGGDLNLVDEHNNVIAKIQLKTKYSSDTETAGALSTSQFFGLISNLQATLNTASFDEVANILYNKLKTSATIYKQFEIGANNIIETKYIGSIKKALQKF